MDSRHDPNQTIYSQTQLKMPSVKSGDRMGHAIVKLYEALLAKKVEPICCAYQVLYEIGKSLNVADIIGAVADAIGQDARKMIVSAYSHRHCFMCSEGSVQCDQCEGSGEVAPGRICLRCDGLGLSPCDFCHGTDWADRQTIPMEIRPSVLERHIAHVNNDVKKLLVIFEKTSPDAIKSLAKPTQLKLLKGIMRAQAQIEYLMKTEAAAEPENMEHFKQMLEKMTELAKFFKPTPTRP